MKIEEKVLLAPYTTFGIGGHARYFASVTSEQELVEALEFAQEKNLRIFILGSGSNILVSDQGFDGLVIHNQIKDFKSVERDDEVFITSGAGENWDTIVERSVAKGLSGIELLSGIPGTIGAAPVQNIGAYGTSVDRVLQSVRVYNRTTKTFEVLTQEQCHFSYRSSIFKEQGISRYIITSVTLRFSQAQGALPSYPDLASKFEKGGHPSVASLREAVIEIRASKGMVVMPEYESYKSAGSFFQNPIVSKEQFEDLLPLPCKTPWYWVLTDGRVKISAACLIQQAGFVKGYREGNVGLSPRHTLAIVNYGNATSSEIRNFAKSISERVKEKFSITLEQEVQYIGL